MITINEPNPKIAARAKESTIERYLVTQVAKHKGLCWKWVSPGHSGVPDRIVMLPGQPPVFVEVKAPTGRLSAIQRVVHEQLKRAGQTVYVVYKQEDVTALIYALTDQTS
jgi:hypothetical protein